MIEDQGVVQWLRATYDVSALCDKEHNAHGGLGYGLLHYAWVRNLRPTRALAIGSRTGFIPACIAAAIRANGLGMLDFVDAALGPNDKKNWGGVAWWKEHDYGDLGDVVSMNVQRTDEFFPSLPNNITYQYIHIDGAHDYDTAHYDLTESIARLSPGGIISLHDTAQPESAGGYGVASAVAKFRDTWNVIELRECAGNVWMQRR
jgi:predicted O-methyltransferase YrrM